MDVAALRLCRYPGCCSWICLPNSSWTSNVQSWPHHHRPVIITFKLLLTFECCLFQFLSTMLMIETHPKPEKLVCLILALLWLLTFTGDLFKETDPELWPVVQCHRNHYVAKYILCRSVLSFMLAHSGGNPWKQILACFGKCCFYCYTKVTCLNNMKLIDQQINFVNKLVIFKFFCLKPT